MTLQVNICLGQLFFLAEWMALISNCVKMIKTSVVTWPSGCLDFYFLHQSYQILLTAVHYDYFLYFRYLSPFILWNPETVSYRLLEFYELLHPHLSLSPGQKKAVVVWRRVKECAFLKTEKLLMSQHVFSSTTKLGRLSVMSDI